MSLKGNIGEWSEIYTFLHVLAYGKLDVADESLKAIPGEFYRIIEVLRQEFKSSNRYIREDDHIRIFINDEKSHKEEEFSIPVKSFADNCLNLLKHLKGNTKRSMSFEDIESFLHDIKVYSIKDTGNKRDITIRIEDFRNGGSHLLGFSIKSLIGQNSTLFNAGAGTNFIYRIEFPSDIAFDMDKFNRETYIHEKISTRINRLEQEFSAHLIFDHIQSDILQQNLMMIDGDLPSIMAEMLLTRYRHKLTTIKACADRLSIDNPLGFDLSRHQPFYKYKIKKFLQDAAMGMTPETVWNGHYDATGGQIIVKENGDIVCYHIYELNRFLEFLLNFTYFEQPATGESSNNPGHQKPDSKKNFFFGWVYKEGNEYFIKLNLQVRMRG